MTMEHPTLRLVLTTFPEESVAKSIVRQLLEERLIACGTLLPGAQSLYHWKGVIEESAEIVALLKTDEMTSLRCQDRLSELHPYEVPEIVILHPERVSTPYAAWVKDVLRIPDSSVE